jgi:hypothetical protein
LNYRSTALSSDSRNSIRYKSSRATVLALVLLEIVDLADTLGDRAGFASDAEVLPFP